MRRQRISNGRRKTPIDILMSSISHKEHIRVSQGEAGLRDKQATPGYMVDTPQRTTALRHSALSNYKKGHT